MLLKFDHRKKIWLVSREKGLASCRRHIPGFAKSHYLYADGDHDTPFFQEAYASFPKNPGGELALTEGTYIANTIVPCDHSTTRGRGIGNTILKLTPNLTQADLDAISGHGTMFYVHVPDTAKENIVIRDMTLHGNKDNQANYALPGFYKYNGIWFIATRNGWAQNILFTDWIRSGLGFEFMTTGLTGCYNCGGINCFFTKTGLITGAPDLNIPFGIDTGNDGIYGIGLWFWDNTMRAITIGESKNFVLSNIISKNNNKGIDASTRGDISVVDAQDGIISNFIIDTPRYRGIYIDDSRRVKFKEGLIKDGPQEAAYTRHAATKDIGFEDVHALKCSQGFSIHQGDLIDLRGCSAKYCRDNALFVDEATRVTIDEHTTKNCGGEGVYIKTTNNRLCNSRIIDDHNAAITSNLASDAASGQKDCIVVDASIFTEGEAVTISDDTPLTESNWIDTIDTDTDTITMKNNLANTYTTGQNGKVTVRHAMTRGIREGGDYNAFKDNYVVGGITAELQLITAGEHSIFDREMMSSELDLSGGATDHPVFTADIPCYLAKVVILYTEASSVDAGVDIRIGKYSDGVALDDDYFDISVSEASKAVGYKKVFVHTNFTKCAIAAGETVTVGTAGGKAGAGAVKVILHIAENVE